MLAACIVRPGTHVAILDMLRPRPHLRVLVTAGAGGAGAAVARALHGAGARVHVCDLDRAALDRLAADTGGITGSMADASALADVDRVFEDVERSLGGLDVLISNAGFVGPAGPIEGISSAGWERTIAVNLNSQYYFARRAIPLLRRSSNGATLIAIAAAVPAQRIHPHLAPCTSSRWAIVGFVRSLAVELAADDIRVNALLPGHVTGPEAANDIAATCLFLCSRAAQNITGQAIGVNGSIDAC